MKLSRTISSGDAASCDPATPLPRGEAPLASKRLRSVDVLRGLAALAVLLVHIPHAAADLPPTLETFVFLSIDLGSFGVTLFLVLSGFCIHQHVARRLHEGNGARADWGRFWRRRFHRLYPPYLAAIVLSLAVAAYLGYHSGRGLLAPLARGDAGAPSRLGWDLATHLLLVHNLFPAYVGGLGNSVFWTMGLEEHLYVLYAVYLFLRRRWPSGRTALAALAVSVTWGGLMRVGLTVLSRHQGLSYNFTLPEAGPLRLGGWGFWPFAFWFCWVLGALSVEAHHGVTRLPAWCYWYSAAAAFAGLAILADLQGLRALDSTGWLPACAETALGRAYLLSSSGISHSLFATACFVVLNRWARDEQAGLFQGWWVRPLAAVGVMSYSLYLTHLPLIQVSEELFPLGKSLAGALLRFALLVPLCLAFGALFFWMVERHFLYRPRTGTGA